MTASTHRRKLRPDFRDARHRDERRLAQDAEIAKLKEEVFASADKQAITDDGEQPIFRESYTGARAPVGAPAQAPL